MAWVLLLLENLGQDKRVESILVPCLDAGSIPAISTNKHKKIIQVILDDFLWSHLGLNQGPPDYESGATNQLSYRTPNLQHIAEIRCKGTAFF